MEIRLWLLSKASFRLSPLAIPLLAHLVMVARLLNGSNVVGWAGQEQQRVRVHTHALRSTHITGNVCNGYVPDTEACW